MTLQEKQHEIDQMFNVIQRLNVQVVQLTLHNAKLTEFLDKAIAVAERSQKAVVETQKISNEYKELSARILKSYSRVLDELKSIRDGK